jgi:hypothetical protein
VAIGIAAAAILAEGSPEEIAGLPFFARHQSLWKKPRSTM